LAHELTHVIQQNGAGVQRQPDPLQRQDEGEEEEREIILPDGEAAEKQPGERGPCDCYGCNPTSQRSTRSVPTTSNGSSPDIQRKNGKTKPPITDYKVRVGKIGFEFDNPGNLGVSPFGQENFNCSHKNATTKTKGDKATVNFTIKLFCPWGVNGGGNTDITSADDAAVTTATHASGKKVYEQIAEDLTPVKSDNWRPPRSFYWSRALTSRHERFHSLQDHKWGKTKGKNVVVNHLKGKTVSVANTAADLTALLDGAMTAMSNANWDWYSGGGKAYIDRPGEKAAFREGMWAYFALARAVKRRGKKLEAAEKKAAKAAAKAAKSGTP
jgi:hypothetical protein